MKEIELRRHAQREKDADALSAEGRALAESLGRTLTGTYDMVFVSPAKRAAETVAWLLRGSGRPLGPHAVVEGLASDREDEWRSAGKAAGSARMDALMAESPKLVAEETARLAGIIDGMLAEVPEGGMALAVGHSPLIESAVYGLTGVIIEPLAELEGVHLTLDEAGQFRMQELRLPPTGSASAT
ncbi:MAG TPA: histidine phosphatase family protein [Actinomycetota bacterium]|nr:histidine phosphatase family protein [Actinomycetota bacterium]